MKLLLCILLAALATPEGWTAPKSGTRSAKQVQTSKASKKPAAKKAVKKKTKKSKKAVKKKRSPRVKLVEGKNTVKFSPPPAARSHAPKSEFPLSEGEALPPPEIPEED